MNKRTWFITGGSSGIGLATTKKVLESGEQVYIGALPPFKELDELITLYPDSLVYKKMDVTDRDKVFTTVKEAHERFGSIDVLYNAAGYFMLSSFDNTTDRMLRNQMEVNFFGSVNVTQAVLQIMEVQGSGIILQMSSDGGIMTNPFSSAYHASKWALEGMYESLYKEISSLGITVTIIEAGPIKTGLVSNGLIMEEPTGPTGVAFKEFLTLVKAAEGAGEMAEDVAKELIRVVNAKKKPLRLLCGIGQLDEIKGQFEERIKTWEEWRWENRPDPTPVSEEAKAVAERLAAAHAQR
jgi:NAD(P)-dependent dehydrogenase (short-subunit alcohol dehydrogenase family)